MLRDGLGMPVPLPVCMAHVLVFKLRLSRELRPDTRRTCTYVRFARGIEWMRAEGCGRRWQWSGSHTPKLAVQRGVASHASLRRARGVRGTCRSVRSVHGANARLPLSVQLYQVDETFALRQGGRRDRKRRAHSRPSWSRFRGDATDPPRSQYLVHGQPLFSECSPVFLRV